MKIHGTQEAEIAALISDNWQGRGLGKELLGAPAVGGGGPTFCRTTAA